jgi:hypothetical protein
MTIETKHNLNDKIQFIKMGKVVTGLIVGVSYYTFMNSGDINTVIRYEVATDIGKLDVLEEDAFTEEEMKKVIHNLGNNLGNQ